MATIDFKKEMNEAKLKMLELGITIRFNIGVQVKDMTYGDLRTMSNKFIVDNMRRLRNAFTDFQDPEVPELDYYGQLTRKEVYFVLRSILMEKKRTENRAKAEAVRTELAKFKTRKEQRKELEAKLALLEA